MSDFGIDTHTIVIVCACFALLRSKYVARSRLSPVLWFIWSIENLITTVCFLQSSSWADGGYNFCIQTITTFLILLLALYYGQKSFSRADYGETFSCLIGSLCWGISNILGLQFLGELSLLALGLIGVFAFYRSLHQNPKSENMGIWTLFLLADAGALVSFSGESFVGFGFLGIELAISLGAVAVCIMCSDLEFATWHNEDHLRVNCATSKLMQSSSKLLHQVEHAVPKKLLLAHAMADA